MWYTLIIPTLCTYYKRCFILFMLCMSLQYTYIISLNYTLLLPSICFKHMPLFYAHYYFLFFSHFCNYMLIIPMLYFSVPKRSSRGCLFLFIFCSGVYSPDYDYCSNVQYVNKQPRRLGKGDFGSGRDLNH